MGENGIKTGDLKFIQKWNRLQILNIIRREGPISRIEIAKKMGLSPTTVTTAVAEMIRGGLAAEIGTGTSNGGRKPVLLQFMPDSKFLIAIAIKNSVISIARMNLNAEIIHGKNYMTGGQKGDPFIQSLISNVEDFLSTESDIKHCIGLSVSCPGIVDSREGNVRYNSRLRLENIPLKKMLEEKFGLKTWLENDANAMALAEVNFGIYRHSQHLIYITVDEGVGAGIIANGKLFCGHGGGAGEFGHIRVVPDGLPCDCGNMGCLENYASWPAIQSQVAKKVEEGRLSLLQNKMSIPDFLKALENKDEVAIEVAVEISDYLSRGLVTLINLFNPQVVILGGDLFSNHSLFFERVTRLTRRSIMKVFADEIIFDSGSFGHEQHLVGAASILLNDQFHFSLSA